MAVGHLVLHGETATDQEIGLAILGSVVLFADSIFLLGLWKSARSTAAKVGWSVALLLLPFIAWIAFLSQTPKEPRSPPDPPE